MRTWFSWERIVTTCSDLLQACCEHILLINCDIFTCVPVTYPKHFDVLIFFCSFFLSFLKYRCVDKDSRINSTVDIPVTYFEQEEFILKFQEYIKSLIEGKSQGKTLKELKQEFDAGKK